MLGIKVVARNAEKARQALLKQGALARDFKAFGNGGFVFFPLAKRVKASGVIVDAVFPRVERRARPLKELLRGKLTEKQLQELASSFDVAGDIAVVEVPRALEKKGKIIASALLESSPRIKTVLKKASAMNGEYRVRKLAWLAGEKRTFTIYKESGCVFRIDLAKTYFSIRLSHERLRIADAAKDGERVLALFAGAGPFPIVIAKRKRVQCVAIELNPDACKMMRENVSLNKLGGSIEVIEGDVARVLKQKRFAKWADRTLMPLPRTGELFLGDAIHATKPGGTVHFYGFTGVEDRKPDYEKFVAKIKAECRKAKRSCRIVNKRVVRPFAPFVVQVSVDFRV